MLLKNLEYWVLAQTILEVGLLLAMGYFLVKLRSWERQLATSRAQEQQALADIGSLALRLSELEQRRATLEEILAQMGRQAATLQGQFAGGEPGRRMPASYGAPSDRNPSLRAQVEGLAHQGFSPDDIARRLGLNLAEVKVALELAGVRSR